MITGAGSAFCSGADLVTRFAAGRRRRQPTRSGPRSSRCSTRSSTIPAPVIAAINGPAIGAGMQLAVACDMRVAALGARIAIPGGKLGIHLSPRNIWRLAQLVGQGAARDFLLAGRTVDADEALRLGLVQYVDHDALGSALDLAGEIAASAPLTVQGHKRALNLVAEAQWLGDAARDGDRRPRSRRVRERRPARGHGRVRGEAQPRVQGPLDSRRCRPNR